MVRASHRPSTSVALRKESVDRNCAARILKTNLAVALRKESVDRNKIFAFNFDLAPSLSARRAWIEIRGRVKD